MRKLLIRLLMLLMLMPGLACGPFMTIGKAHAANGQMVGMPHCHGMAMAKDVGSKKSPPSNATMLFKDCTKVDLSGVDYETLSAPDLIGKVFFIAWATTIAKNNHTPAAVNAIRGPPPRRLDLVAETHPSILLTTQRFRV